MSSVSFISNNIFEIKRKHWVKKQRKRLVNRDFTIISNNCCAGIIYSDLGLQFTSPHNEFIFFARANHKNII